MQERYSSEEFEAEKRRLDRRSVMDSGIRIRHTRHDWLKWLDEFPVKLRRYIDDRDELIKEQLEVVSEREVFEAVCKLIEEPYSLRLIFFAKMDFGDECKMYNGQYWLDEWITHHTNAVKSGGSIEFELNGSKVSGPMMISLQGGIYPDLCAGVMVNLPVECWSSVPKHLLSYHWLSCKLNQWLEDNLKRLKRKLVEQGGSQRTMF